MTDTSKVALIACYDDLVVTPTANFTPQTGYPLSRVAGSVLMERCRGPVSSLTDLQLTFDLGSAKQMNVAMLTGNFTVDALRRFRIADDSGFTANVVQTGASIDAAFNTSLGSLKRYSPPWGRLMLVVLSQDYSRRYARWHVSDSTNPDTYLAFGPARFGMAFQPGIGLEESSWRIPDKLIGPPGAEKVLRGHKVRYHRLTLAESTKLHEFARSVLSVGRMLFVPRPLSPETWLADAIWCTLEGVVERNVIPRTGAAWWEVTLTFREADQ